MKCLAIRVNWHKGFCNDPSLELLVDRIPGMDEMRFEHRGEIWYGELDGAVSFYQWKGPHKEHGFGGATYPITMKDGTQQNLLGPWHVSPSAAHQQGFPHCMDVAITDHPEAMINGHTFCGRQVTVEWARAAIAELAPNLEVRQRGSELHGQTTEFETIKPFYDAAMPLVFFPCTIGKDVAQAKQDAPDFLPLRMKYHFRDEMTEQLRVHAEKQGYELSVVCRVVSPKRYEGRKYLEGHIGAVSCGKVQALVRYFWDQDKIRTRWSTKLAKYFVPFSTSIQMSDRSRESRSLLRKQKFTAY